MRITWERLQSELPARMTESRVLMAEEGTPWRGPVPEPYGDEVRGWIAEYPSPEEWVAHHGHELMLWPYEEYDWAETGTSDWLLRVRCVMSIDGGFEACRERYLDADERSRIEAHLAYERTDDYSY